MTDDTYTRLKNAEYYLTATTSTQQKDIVSAGIKLLCPDLVNSTNQLRLAAGQHRSFMTTTTSAQRISSKIDNATSILMSSRLACQLTKLSH
ncbi:unnamed protein product [Adineta ricciae]|uniref:Uncharacterized protein n=1 Tax=Adineta ricciae TaxID=249248 RepID=A0A814UMK0_ADIRI|nr:unnamed protein product [Adineta ricciae]CAF1434861.1 unnamed protein product [Adineta ricciae]